jgi:hypothetical protein
VAREGDADVSRGGEGLDPFGWVFGVDVAGGVLLEPGVNCGEADTDEALERAVLKPQTELEESAIYLGEGERVS